MTKVKINEYEFGMIRINGEKYSNDVIVFPDHVDGNWWRKKGHSIRIDDIKNVIKYNPDILIIGTGKNGRLNIPEEFKRKLRDKKINLKYFKTDKAVDKFNNLLSQGKDAVAGLHLTC